MNGPVPRIGRWTFVIHLIVAIVFGVGNLFFTRLASTLFGFADVGEFAGSLRALGAIILGLGGVTSYYGARAQRWDQVDFIVRGEVVYLALATLVYLYGLVTGAGPLPANLLFLAVSIGLLVLFLLTWSRRPRQA